MFSRPSRASAPRDSVLGERGFFLTGLDGATISAVNDIIRQHVGNQATVSQVRRWGGGALNECYRVTAQNPPGEYFLKVEKLARGGGVVAASGGVGVKGGLPGSGRADAWAGLPFIPTTRRGQIEREVEGVRLASAAGIPTAPVVGYDLTGQLIGRKYILQEFVDAELLFIIDEYIEDREDEEIRSQLADIMKKMEAIHGPGFGDLCVGGAIGRHPTWRGAYDSMRRILLHDLEALDVLPQADLKVISDALEWGSEQIGSAQTARKCPETGKTVSQHLVPGETQSERADPEQARADVPPSFVHTDLGKHNVLVERSGGAARIRALVDFGNSMYAPYYIEEFLIREFGGWMIGPADIPSVYGITPQEFTAAQLLFGLELGVFAFALNPYLGKLDEQYMKEFVGRYRAVLG